VSRARKRSMDAPTFVATIPLRATPAQAKEVASRFECARLLYNSCLREALDRAELMRADPGWEVAKNMPRLLAGKPNLVRAAEFRKLRERYGFTRRALASVASGFRVGWLREHVSRRRRRCLAPGPSMLFISGCLASGAGRGSRARVMGCTVLAAMTVRARCGSPPMAAASNGDQGSYFHSYSTTATLISGGRRGMSPKGGCATAGSCEPRFGAAGRIRRSLSSMASHCGATRPATGWLAWTLAPPPSRLSPTMGHGRRPSAPSWTTRRPNYGGCSATWTASTGPAVLTASTSRAAISRAGACGPPGRDGPDRTRPKSMNSTDAWPHTASPCTATSPTASLAKAALFTPRSSPTARSNAPTAAV